MKTPSIFQRYRLDRIGIALLALGALFVAGRAWLAENPQHNPWAPLNLSDPPGWATQRKIHALENNPEACRAVLERGEVSFSRLEPRGEGPCRQSDRLVLDSSTLAPQPASTCSVAIGFELWIRHSVQPAAREMLGSPVTSIGHFGTYSCRRMNNAEDGLWSEHATGNAIDIASFTLQDGRELSLLNDWGTERPEATFLRNIRDGACQYFSTVLSPDYNNAHRDHFHFDQGSTWIGGCR